MLQMIQIAGEITYQDLSDQLEKKMQPTFDGSIF